MPKQRLLSSSKRVFVIRDERTGLYSTGGFSPSFVPIEKAKTYRSPTAVASHLKLYARGQYKGEAKRVPASWEVVEFEVIHNQKWSNDALGFLKARKRS